MVTKLPRRTSATGPALVRLLSRLAQVEAQAPDAPLAASLNQWLGWSESIVLSTALNAPMPKPAAKEQEPAADAGNLQGSAVEAGQEHESADNDAGKEHGNASEIVDEAELAHAEYTQLRTSLLEAIRLAVAPPAPLNDRLRRQMRPTAQTAEADFPTHRRRYVAAQQKMETSVAAVRARLRAMLAARSQESARLAAVDAAMEQALAPHEQRLLAEIPHVLERRFQGLSHAETTLKEQQGSWLDTFREDMQSVLAAELDLRLEPIQGLLATLTAGPQR